MTLATTTTVTTGYVGWLGLVASLSLVGIAVRYLGVAGARARAVLVWASVRAIVQLLAVGAVLALVFSPHVPLAVSWAWVLFMVVFAADTIRRRAPEVPGARGLALVSLGPGDGGQPGVLFGLRIFPLDARHAHPAGRHGGPGTR